MVRIQPVREIRPELVEELNPPPFKPRSPAMAEAYRWGKEKHAGQLRLNGEPYFESHCEWVASFVEEKFHNEVWTVAALLHDTVEDQGVSLEEIRGHFPGALGQEVARIVDGVTKLGAPREGVSRDLDAFRKLVMYRDLGVFLVKLADKTHNLLTLGYMGEPRRKQKAEEAIRAYGKLAGILNCYTWRRWLEDMAFPYAEPRHYQDVKSVIDRDPRLSLAFIQRTMEQLAQIMEAAGLDGSVEIVVNGYWQAWQKLRRLALSRKASLNDYKAVNDLVSFRLVLDDLKVEKCYELLGHVNHVYGETLDQDNFDDFIACPQNGYRALQTTTWLPGYGSVEIAISTHEMEEENRWGVVYVLRQGRDIHNYHPVVILTPSGGVRFVPEGSSVLDAVAAIQQEFLLDKISAIRVNGRLADVSDRINSGDVVEVITEGQRLKPREEWLRYCNPITARLVRSVLVMEALKDHAEEGRRKIKDIVAGRGILALEDVQALERDRTDNLLERLGCSSLEDLYAALGGGVIDREDLQVAMDQVGITKDGLKWHTLYVQVGKALNQPGMLARFTKMVSAVKGNIIRTVNTNLPDGGFEVRMVIENLDPKAEKRLASNYSRSNIPLVEFILV